MPTGKSKAYLNESDPGPICPAGSLTLPCKWVGRLDNAGRLQDADWLLLRHLSSHYASHSPVPKPWSQQHADFRATGLLFNWGTSSAILCRMLSRNYILHASHGDVVYTWRATLESGDVACWDAATDLFLIKNLIYGLHYIVSIAVYS